MKNFWTQWELWQKMVFCLGCFIALTLGYATFIRWRNKRRTAKHATLSEVQRAENAQTTKRNKRAEVPFGIRCLEEGIDVEGVWSSNANTPLQSPKSSAPSSPSLAPTTDSPAKACTSKDTPNSKTSTSKRKLEKRSRRTSLTKSERTAKSPGGPSTGKPSVREPPESRKSPALETMRGRPAWQPSQHRNSHSFSRSTSRNAPAGGIPPLSSTKLNATPGTSKASDPIQAQPNTSYVTKSARRRESVRGPAIDPVYRSKKLSETSEAGVVEAAQLSTTSQTISSRSPPDRPRAAGSIKAPTKPSGREILAAEAPSRSAPWPLTDSDSQFNQPAPNGVSTARSSIAVPFKVFAENHPVPSTRHSFHSQDNFGPQRLIAKGQSSPDAIEPASGKLYSHQSTGPRTRYSMSPEDEVRPYRNTTSRRVNAGFEILPAGTFAGPRNERTRSSTMSSRRTSIERQPRKLRKRRYSESEAQP